MQGAWVQSLVRELRSRIPHGAAKNKYIKKKNPAEDNQSSWNHEKGSLPVGMNGHMATYFSDSSRKSISSFHTCTNILSHTEAGESPTSSLLHFGEPPPVSLYPSVCEQNSSQLIVKYLNLKYTIQNVYIHLNIKESTLRISAEGHLVNVY